jgi:cysteine desulfurase / selenocysteine lyase
LPRAPTVKKEERQKFQKGEQMKETDKTKKMDLEKYRKEFPFLKNIIYFNHASIGPLPLRSLKAVNNYYEYATLKKTESIEKLCFGILDDTRKRCAQLINAKLEEVNFSFNTSYGLNFAVWGLDLKPGDKILLSDVEFPANVYPWMNLKSKGIKIKFIPSKDSFFDIDNFLKAIDSKTKVLSLSYVQFFNGFKNDLKTIGEICEENDIFFVVDGIQGVGNLNLDVKECKIDFLSTGGAKWLLSSLGTGFFYYSQQAKRKMKPSFFGWMGVDWGVDFTDLLRFDKKPFPDARRFSVGSYPFHNIMTMHASLGLLLEVGIKNIEKHNLKLLDILIDFLKDSPYQIKSSLHPAHRSSILTFSGRNPQRLFEKLTRQNILVSFREKGIRVSPHFYNTQEEMDEFIEILRKNT